MDGLREGGLRKSMGRKKGGVPPRSAYSLGMGTESMKELEQLIYYRVCNGTGRVDLEEWRERK